MSAQRVRLVLLLAIMVGGLMGFWIVARSNSRLNFLPTRPPANWILYATPPDTEMHPAVPIWTEFRHAFQLTSIPANCTLELRACKEFQVRLNGQSPATLPASNGDWKNSSRLNLSALLKSGTNLISIFVTNRSGPPALWAVLKSGDTTLITDATWESSLVGAVWQPAVLAGAGRTRQPGDPLFGGETAGAAFSRVWWIWLIGFSVIAVVMRFRSKITDLLKSLLKKLSPSVAEWLPLAVVALLWVILFTNNLPQLPSLFGFDTDGHTEYIRYVQQHVRLPLAHEGWQMYQPPLYYVLGAAVLAATGNGMDESSTWLIRALSGAIGLANLALVWLSLRRLFPTQRGAAVWGIAFAASLPALLCVSQFITNEGLAAMLSSATLYCALRTVQSGARSAVAWGATGACLGFALLAKFSAFVLAPFLCGWLGWVALYRHHPAVPVATDATPGGRSFRGNARSVAPRLGFLLMLGVCLLVCGWHYGRVWLRFGSPLIGNWSPESGFSWWQENGFSTAKYFLSFGRALTTPLFSGFDSLGDGLYSTLWADGLCSGGTRLTFRPPWNYSLMVAGLWLALLPTMLIVAGAVGLVKRWLRTSAPADLFWPALLAAYVVGVAVMTLRVPSYAQAKAVYALGALLPLCVCLLNGLETIRQANRWLHHACGFLLALWMLNAYASVWIRSGAAETHRVMAANLLDLGYGAEALKELDRAQQIAPSNARLASQRSAVLQALGRVGEARAAADVAMTRMGVASGAWLELANDAAARGDFAAAAALALEAAAKLPDDPMATHNAALWTLQAGHPRQAEELCRRALRIRFANAALHFLLGKTLSAQGQDAEALNHLRLAVTLKPDWPMALNDLAWILASHPDAAWRNGSEAVKLAERACELTQRQQPLLLGTLAAAYAEAGRFPEAVQAAESAIQSARAAGLHEIVSRNEALLKLYRAGKAYREPRSLPVDSWKKPPAGSE